MNWIAMAPWIDGSMDVISGICIAIGSLFAVIGGIGIIRLPDFYTRLHGGGMTDTLGAGLILLGLMVHSTKVGLIGKDGLGGIVDGGLSGGMDIHPWLVTVKLLMILFFLFVTNSTSCHALASSALACGFRPLHPERSSDDSASD